MRKDTRLSPAFPYCKQWKVEQGPGNEATEMGMIPRKYCSYYPYVILLTLEARSQGVLPDDCNKLAHGQLLRNEELGFVQKRQVLLLVVPLDNYLPVQEQGRDQAQS